MARSTFSLLPLVLSLLYLVARGNSAVVPPAADFIGSSCRVTSYPAVCVRSLSGYAAAVGLSRRELAQVALSVSLDRIRSVRSFLNQFRSLRGLKRIEYQALNDCLEQVGDGLDRVSNSIGEIKAMGTARGPDFVWHMSNVQTWVSSALTDETTCVDGFSGPVFNPGVRNPVRTQVTQAAQITSNALALVNNFAEKH